MVIEEIIALLMLSETWLKKRYAYTLMIYVYKWIENKWTLT